MSIEDETKTMSVENIEVNDVVREPYGGYLAAVRDITVEQWDSGSAETYLTLELLEPTPNHGIGEHMTVGVSSKVFLVAKAENNRG